MDIIGEVIPIAGELKEKGGGDMDAKFVRLATDGSHADSEKEGLRLTMNGGWTTVDGKKRPQKAIIEFLCDATRTGNENLFDPEDKYEKRMVAREEDEKDKEGDDKKDGEGDGKKDDEKDGKKDGDEEDDSKSSSLKFLRYDTSGENEDVLRLQWRTKYACEHVEEADPVDPAKKSWGFFTWFIIM